MGSQGAPDRIDPCRRVLSASYTPVVWLATGLGVGRVAPAPGTVAALVWGMPLAWAISLLPAKGWEWAILIGINIFGVPLCTRAGRDLGGSKDNQAIVWDEIVTVPMAFLVVPLTNWQVALTGFVLVRLFDVTKPPPVRQLEALPEGLGVMADDWVAGVYACLAVWLINVLAPVMTGG